MSMCFSAPLVSRNALEILDVYKRQFYQSLLGYSQNLRHLFLTVRKLCANQFFQVVAACNKLVSVHFQSPSE